MLVEQNSPIQSLDINKTARCLNSPLIITDSLGYVFYYTVNSRRTV